MGFGIKLGIVCPFDNRSLTVNLKHKIMLILIKSI